MTLQFVDRNSELEALHRLLDGRKASLVLLYGRRRIGKTRLIQKFMKGKRGLYFYVPNEEKETILTEYGRRTKRMRLPRTCTNGTKS